MSSSGCFSIGEGARFHCPVQLESETRFSLVTMVAIGAVALIAIGLAAYLQPSGPLFKGLGVVGAITVASLGGIGLVSILPLVVCQSRRNKELLEESESDCGSVVVHDNPKRPLVFDIDWNQQSEKDSKGTLTIHTTGSPYSSTSSMTGHRELLPALPEEEKALSSEELETLMATFKRNFSENALRGQPLLTRSFDTSLNASQIERLTEAKQYIHRIRQREEWGITLHGSGENIVFEVTGLGGLIFKVGKEQPKNLEEVERYVQLRSEAQEICSQKGLNLIRIPACSFVMIGDEYVIVEERIEELSGDYYFQKSLYEWGLEQPRLQGYFKALFGQMLVFVCGFKFGDFKYDNIPLNQFGQAVFLDLDQWGAEEGLTQGFAQSKSDGLLSYLPQEWLEEMIAQAESLLGKKLEVEDVRERVTRRTERRALYRQFLESEGIKTIAEPVRFKKKSEDPPETLAEVFCQLFNEKLKTTQSCDLQVGRELEIDFQPTGEFWKVMVKPQGFTKFNSIQGKTGRGFLNNIPLAFQLLKERGNIFDFEYQRKSTRAVVYV